MTLVSILLLRYIIIYRIFFNVVEYYHDPAIYIHSRC